MTTTTIQKWGNSYAVRLPVATVKNLGLKAGREVGVRAQANGSIIITPERMAVPSMKELLRSITKKNRHAEVDWGRPVGSEVW